MEKLHVFLASVIDSKGRLKRFKQLLQSATDQLVKPDFFSISIYIDPQFDISNEDLQGMLCNLTVLSTDTFILRQKRKKSQFVQYRDLLNRKKGKGCWIVFSDDDDLWSPIRISTFKMAIADNKNKNVKGIKMAEQTCNKNPICCDINTPKDVNKAMECGCVDIQERSPGQLVEYHEWCVGMTLFEQFCKKNKYLIEKNKYCDVEFRYYLQTYNGKKGETMVIQRTEPQIWYYFYRDARHEYKCVSDNSNYNTSDPFKDFRLFCNGLAQQMEISSMKNFAINTFKKAIDIWVIDGNYPKKILYKIMRDEWDKRVKLAKKYNKKLGRIDF